MVVEVDFLLWSLHAFLVLLAYLRNFFCAEEQAKCLQSCITFIIKLINDINLISAYRISVIKP